MSLKEIVTRQLAEARSAETAGNLTKASLLLKRVAQRQNSEVLMLWLADIERRRRRLRSSIRMLDKALKLNPKRALTYIFKAQCLCDLRKYDFAAMALKQALKIEKRADAFVLLGSIYEQLQNSTTASRYYRYAIECDESFEEAHYNRGRLLRKSDPKKSLWHLKKAVKLDPTYGLAYAELGGVMLQLNRYNEAEIALRKAIQLDPNSIWNHLYLANLFWKTGRVEQAKAEYEAAAKIDSTRFSNRCLQQFLAKRDKGFK